MSTKDTGDKGEQIACGYLVNNGYKILGRNYRINFGEIDIIAKKKFKFFGKNDEIIHFVEVKTLQRPTLQFFPEQRVDSHKQDKYRGLVDIWLTKNKYSLNTSCQVDIVAVTMSGESYEVDFFENVVSN